MLEVADPLVNVFSIVGSRTYEIVIILQPMTDHSIISDTIISNLMCSLDAIIECSIIVKL